MLHNQRTSMYKHSWAISMVTLLSHRCWKSKSLPKQHAGRCLIPAFALFLLSTALLWLLFYWIVLYSTCCEWEMCVASAEGHSPTSDTLGRARALNTTCPLSHSILMLWPLGCWVWLQVTPTRLSSCEREIQLWLIGYKYSKKDLGLFFRRHCVITITSVKGDQIYLSAMLYCDGKTLECHSSGFNTQLLVIDSVLFHSRSQPDWLYHGIC